MPGTRPQIESNACYHILNFLFLQQSCHVYDTHKMFTTLINLDMLKLQPNPRTTPPATPTEQATK